MLRSNQSVRRCPVPTLECPEANRPSVCWVYETGSSTLDLLAPLARTTPDFLLQYTVGSWKNECRLQWLTIRQTEPSGMFPHHEFRFQLTTNYCKSCLLEDAATTRIEFFRLQWLLAPQTICPRHLTFLRETCRCCNRRKHSTGGPKPSSRSAVLVLLLRWRRLRGLMEGKLRYDPTAWSLAD
jgi:hypothetical protein